jgi:hypothetical protein
MGDNNMGDNNAYGQNHLGEGNAVPAPAPAEGAGAAADAPAPANPPPMAGDKHRLDGGPNAGPPVKKQRTDGHLGGRRRRRTRRKSRKGRKPHRKSRKVHRKSHKARRGKRGGRTRRQRGGNPLVGIAAELQNAVNGIGQLFQNDKARTAIIAQQSQLQAVKRDIAAATQSTQNILSKAAAQLVNKPNTGRIVAKLQQAAYGSQYATRLPGMYYKRSLVRP